jgi:hypothetical protein
MQLNGEERYRKIDAETYLEKYGKRSVEEAGFKDVSSHCD